MMDEFNDVQQEQHFDFGEKKNTTRKTIKRTLLAIGLALAVYMVYSIVHLFLSPDRNIQQVYLVPEDAAFIIQSSRLRSRIGKSSVEVKHGNV